MVEQTTMTETLFEVGITYCNNYSLLHNHKTVTGAAQEYAEMLLAGLEPATYNQHEKHVRMVTLIKMDSDGHILQHIYSGVFPCEHRPVVAE